MFIHSFMDRALDYFYLLGVTNNAAMNMGVQIALRDPAFNSFGYLFSDVVAGSFYFNFLRNFHVVFHSNHTTFHYHQQCTVILVFHIPCQHLLFSICVFVCLFIATSQNPCEMTSKSL